MALLSVICFARVGLADAPLFTEDFESYPADSNLVGQGDWDGLTNQGTFPEMPITEGSYLASGQVLDTRAIVEADRIHQVGHPLPALDSATISILSVDAYALGDSINTGIGIGENPSPGTEIATGEFLTTYRAHWDFAADGWFFDLRGIAGLDESNIFRLATGTDRPVSLEIVIDGPAGVIYGRLDDGDDVVTTPARAITAGQISALDAVAIFSDRSLPNRAGVEFDNIRLIASPREDPSPCGDVDASGVLLATDALAVLKAAVGQPVALQCPPAAQPLKTGQTTCHDENGAPLSCVGTLQDGELQLGVARSFADNGDGTISDHATGLMWEKLADDGSIHDQDNLYDWLGAFDKVADLNDAAFGGHADWRLPNVRELETLRDFNVSGPPIAPIFREPCEPGETVLTASCAPSGYHWSSSTWSGNLAVAWVVLFETGTTDASLKNTARHVRAVRGGD